MSLNTRDRLKRLIVETMNFEGVAPDSIDDNAPLFGESLGLDSVDALELVVALEKEYGFRIENTDSVREAFYSVATLAAYVDRMCADPESRSPA
jgi:acyl carrier protein